MTPPEPRQIVRLGSGFMGNGAAKLACFRNPSGPDEVRRP